MTIPKLSPLGRTITNHADDQYLEMAQAILSTGAYKADRTGTGTYSLFGHQMRFDQRAGFPLLTTKKLHTRSILVELLWFLNGDTNIKYLQENKCSIWDEWADENGELGPVYGAQWRSWPGRIESVPAHKPAPANARRIGADFDEAYITYQHGIDQIQNLLNDLRNNPDSRRLIVNAWNVADIPKMKLPPCHAFWQCYTVEMTLQERWSWWAGNNEEHRAAPEEVMAAGEQVTHEIMDNAGIPRRWLDLQLYQRSADTFLGVPFNIASYSFLLHMIAQQVNMAPRDFIWTGGDIHVYSNHVDQMRTQIERDLRPMPQLKLRKAKDLFSYSVEDFVITGYDPHPHIAGKVAV